MYTRAAAGLGLVWVFCVFCTFFLPRASLFVLRVFFVFLVYFLLFDLSFQYQCKTASDCLERFVSKMMTQLSYMLSGT